MNKTRILTLQQISESENKYINENSEEKYYQLLENKLLNF